MQAIKYGSEPFDSLALGFDFTLPTEKIVALPHSIANEVSRT